MAVIDVKYNAVWKKGKQCYGTAQSIRWYSQQFSAGFRVRRQTHSRTLHAEGLYPFHIERIQHLEPAGMVSRLASCCLSNADRNISPTDETDLPAVESKKKNPPPHL